MQLIAQRLIMRLLLCSRLQRTRFFPIKAHTETQT